VAEWKLPTFKITDSQLTLAGRAWHAWRAPTPERCFDLLMEDLAVLPRLRPALITMLLELPDLLTGLGEIEMEILAFIEDGGSEPREILRAAAEFREVFDEGEAGEMLWELAKCPAPVVFEVGDTPLDATERGRPFQYKGGLSALTELGRAILAGEEDFARHNQIRRWWGGTHLTNEKLWRWNPQSRSLVAP
jgi:hypothetical protein